MWKLLDFRKGRKMLFFSPKSDRGFVCCLVVPPGFRGPFPAENHYTLLLLERSQPAGADVSFRSCFSA
jgi:hypothetical protein